MAKDRWDKADIIGKLAGSVLIPVGLAAATYIFNVALAERAARQKTVETAITILQSEKTDKTPALRDWALGVLQQTTTSASHELPPAVIDELKQAPLPVAESVRAPIPMVGRRFTPTEFRQYVETLDFSSWRPQFVVLHNTSAPRLSQWHDVPGDQRMKNLAEYYGMQQGWKGGPHLFIDDDGIWVFNPLNRSGVHSPSWNAISWGVTMVGEYSEEPFDDKVRDNTVEAIATLDSAVNIDPATLRFHKDDPITTHKECPGSHVDKADLIQRIKTAMARKP